MGDLESWWCIISCYYIVKPLLPASSSWPQENVLSKYFFITKPIVRVTRHDFRGFLWTLDDQLFVYSTRYCPIAISPTSSQCYCVFSGGLISHCSLRQQHVGISRWSRLNTHSLDADSFHIYTSTMFQGWFMIQLILWVDTCLSFFYIFGISSSGQCSISTITMSIISRFLRYKDQIPSPQLW